MLNNTLRTVVPALGLALVCVSSIATAQSGQSSSAPAPGYVHDLGRSRFKIGQDAKVELDSPQFRRWRGSLGAWATDPTNNWSMGLLDASAPTGPYILDESVHSARVKQYFIDAGLPADQVRDVRATFEGFSGGLTDGAAASSPIRLHSINSILTRSVKGVPVIESVAWAKMTTAGDVDMECVFWPAIDPGVVDRAAAFQRAMADKDAHAAYLAKLPGKVYRDGGVVIHHTDPSIHAAPGAFVSYDVTLSAEGHTAMRHFDESGVEFRLPQEMQAAVSAPAGQQ
jgi:hypothetical protein